MTDDVESRLSALEDMLQEVREAQVSHTGSSWGAGNQSWPHSTALFPFREIHGPLRQSINTSFPIEFIVDFDTFITKLHRAKLSFKLYPVRSNVSASSSASGGGATSSTGSPHTHTLTATTTAGGGGTTVSSTSGGSQTPTSSSGGSQSPTSSGGGSTTETSTSVSNHTHGIALSAGSHVNQSLTAITHNHTSATTDTASGHVHTVSGGTGNTVVTFSSPSTTLVVGTITFPTIPANTSNGGGTHDHDITLADHTHSVTVAAHTHTVTVAAHDHDVTLSNHTHSISGAVTAATEAAHTHTIGDHSHTITLSYGIYEGAAPSAPAIGLSINGVSRTVALGGPWNTAQNNIDITDYLRETSGDPLRGLNTLSFTSTELIDMQITVKSICFAQELLGIDS